VPDPGSARGDQRQRVGAGGSTNSAVKDAAIGQRVVMSVPFYRRAGLTANSTRATTRCAPDKWGKEMPLAPNQTTV